MNKLLMAMLILGASSCAMYQEQHEASTRAGVGGEDGAAVSVPRSPRFDGKDYNDDFGEYDD